MSDNVNNIRLVAIDILSNLLTNNGSLSTQLNKHQGRINASEAPLLKEICFGVSRYFPLLNSVALHILEKPLPKKDRDIYAAILIGLYQIDYMQIPPHAAVNEIVSCIKGLNKPWAVKLVNAVLRNYLRNNAELKVALKDIPSVKDIHPKWLLKRFEKHWPKKYQQIVDANNSHPPLCLRVNLSRVSRETQKKLLTQAGIKSHFGLFSSSALYLEKPVKIQDLPGFFDGYLSVQDEAAQLSAEILQPQSGERVLDACSAPGGKTCHLLESAEGIKLTALELEDWRLKKVQENLERLSLSAQLICTDAADLPNWWDGIYYDKILLDVPCSATGVIRRNPDIKISRKASDIEALKKIQQYLLTSVWKTLKVDGLLLYATCSLMPEENEKQVAQFLASNSNAEEVQINKTCGQDVQYGKQLFPSLGSHDGFYYCLIKKTF